MNKTIRELLKLIGVLCLCVCVGTLSMIAVYALPTDRMEENVRDSLTTFEREGTYPLIIDGYYGSMLDNYTDGLMLNIAISGKDYSTHFAAMSNFYANYFDCVNPMFSLLKYMSDKRDEGLFFEFYSRYWHGYNLWLKPLLMVTNYSGVRLINMAWQLGLLVLLLWQMMKKKLGRYIPALLLAWYAMCPITVLMNLEYSMSFTMALIASNAVLLLSGRHGRASRVWPYVFMLTGIAESFFCFLVNPVLGIVTSMGVWCMVYQSTDLKQNILDMLKHGFAWAFGYLGMMIAKPVVSSILTKRNNVAVAFEKMSYHTAENADGKAITRFSGFETTSRTLFSNPVVVIACIALAVFCVVLVIRSPKEGLRRNLLLHMPLLLLALVPVAWTIVTATHSYQHFWFTFRTLSGMLLLAGSFLLGVAWTQWEKRTASRSER